MDKGKKKDNTSLGHRLVVLQNIDNVKRAVELDNANKEVASHKVDKSKRAAELVVANKKVAFEKAEKAKRAAELLIANAELIFQNSEKEKRAKELLIANRELVYQNEEKEKRAAELIIANQELAFQNLEKEKRAEELIKACDELKRAESHLKEYIYGMEEMMFITSHKLRQPVANILGLSSMLEEFLDSPENLKKMVSYLKESAVSLDVYTRELTAFITDLDQKGKE